MDFPIHIHNAGSQLLLPIPSKQTRLFVKIVVRLPPAVAAAAEMLWRLREFSFILGNLPSTDTRDGIRGYTSDWMIGYVVRPDQCWALVPRVLLIRQIS